jgi:molecular chaperone GrpE (heat shock protein)
MLEEREQNKMIDFHKELAKFNFVDDAELTAFENETSQVIEAINFTLKRIGKELNNSNIQLEEVLAMQTEETEKNKFFTEQHKAMAATEAQKLSLVHALVATLDLLEDIYRYSQQNERNSWAEQMQILWHKAAANILLLGITRIEGENTIFDSRIHAAVETQENKALQNGLILEVLRSGYIYNAQVLRKACVIVNKTDGGEEL